MAAVAVAVEMATGGVVVATVEVVEAAVEMATGAVVVATVEVVEATAAGIAFGSSCRRWDCCHQCCSTQPLGSIQLPRCSPHNR